MSQFPSRTRGQTMTWASSGADAGRAANGSGLLDGVEVGVADGGGVTTGVDTGAEEGGMVGGADVTGGLATVPRSRSAMTTPAPMPSSTAASTTTRTRTRPDGRGPWPADSPAGGWRRRFPVGRATVGGGGGLPTTADGAAAVTGNGAVGASAGSGPVAGAKCAAVGTGAAALGAVAAPPRWDGRRPPQ